MVIHRLESSRVGRTWIDPILMANNASF